MNSFNAVSGTIDALVAVGIYGALVFGIRALAHRTRKTEPNPANNKWLWLTVLGLAAAVFVGRGSMTPAPAASSSTTSSNACFAAVESSKDLMASLSTKNKGSVAYSQEWLILANLVTGNPDCFDPQTVASARAKMQQYLGH